MEIAICRFSRKDGAIEGAGGSDAWERGMLEFIFPEVEIPATLHVTPQGIIVSKLS
jgi:hypothetical protein